MPQALPAGAEYGTDFDQLGSRVVYSADYCQGPPIVKASCHQSSTGAILDDPVDEGPRVNVMVDPGTTLSIGQARELAAAVFLAAVQAEAWAIEATQDRHPAGKGRNLWPVNSDYCAACNTIGEHRTEQHPAAIDGRR